MFAHRMVPFGLTTSILAVCPFDTHTIPLTSTGGRSSTGSTYSHCTESQLPLPILPEYLTSIIMPVRMTVKPFELYRVTESYSAGQYEFLPSFLHVLEDAQIGLEVIPCGGLDVGMPELSCDHADVGSGLDRQRAERVA